MNKFTLNINKIILALFLFVSPNIMFSQSIVIDAPVLGFNKACSSDTHLNYNVQFSYFPEQGLESGNEFILELSDANGNFSAPVSLKTWNDTAESQTISFDMPKDVFGEGYKVRIRSTKPDVTSNPSASFGAHYAEYNKLFSINNGQDQVSICDNKPYILKIDGGPGSPLENPKLKYIWYKGGSPVSGVTGGEYTVTESDRYSVYVDYGSCTENYYSVSNEVTVTMSDVDLKVTITSSHPEICDKPVELESDINDPSYEYQWYLDDNKIAGATSAIYNTVDPGSYHLVVAIDKCSFKSESIVLRKTNITADLNVPDNVVLLPGESKTITVTTNANPVEFKWTKDGNDTGQNQASITIQTSGVYSVTVKQTDGCIIEKTVTTSIVSPTGFGAIIKPDDQYQACNSKSVILRIDRLLAMVLGGGEIDVLNELQNISYQWYKGGAVVPNATAKTLELNDSSKSDNYKLQVTVNGFSAVDSDPIDVKLAFNKEVTIGSDEVLCDNNPTVTINSSVTDAAYTYKWYKEGNPNVVGTESHLEADASGVYRLDIEQNGCTKSSNSYNVAMFDPAQVKVNAPENITVVNGSSKKITASGANDYTWYKDSVVVSSTADLTIREEGIYILKAAIGNCEVTKTFTVTLVENTSVIVPNVISPNGDGINDTWSLPNDYAYQSNVEIVIISPGGKILFKQKDYQNDWPQGAFNYSNGPVVYYQIIKDNKVVKQGSITILK